MINHRAFTRRAAIGLSAFALLGLNGCASLILGSTESPPRYTLEPLDNPVTGAEQMQVRLVVSDPLAEAAFDTFRISYSPEHLRYEYYADGEWTDQLPLLVGIFLQRSFENDGRIQTVGDRRAVPLGDYVLRTDIRAFHVESRGGELLANVSYSAKLFNDRNRAIATRVFSTAEPLDGPGLNAAVEALNRAMKKNGQPTVDWAVLQMQQNPPVER